MAYLSRVVGGLITSNIRTALKTVTPTAAELFAGTKALQHRTKLLVYNPSEDTAYWGNGLVTPGTGFPLLPGDSIVFSLDPREDIPIYFVAETSVAVRVGELA